MNTQPELCLSLVPVIGVAITAFVAGIGVSRTRNITRMLKLATKYFQLMLPSLADKTKLDDYLLRVLEAVEASLPEEQKLSSTLDQQTIIQALSQPELIADLIKNPDLSKVRSLVLEAL